MVEESYLDDYELDRKFLNLSSMMSDVFSNTYGWLGYRLVSPFGADKFDNAEPIKEVAIRAFILIGMIASVSFAGSFILASVAILTVGSKIFRAAGFYFQKDGFTHIRGHASEKTLDQSAKVMTWNIRGHGGGLHYPYGGVVHWKSRVDRIVDEILKEGADVVVLQEVYDTALVEALIEKLEDSYAHFYTHLGTKAWDGDTGCMVITKCAVHSFKNCDFDEKDGQARGFEMFEIKATPEASSPCARIIGTQLSPGSDRKETREKQIGQILNTLKGETFDLPTLFVGNMNFSRKSQEGELVSQYLYHSYLGDEPTHTHELVNQWAPVFEGQEESGDFISFFKRSTPEGRILPVLERGIRLVDSHLVKGFDETHNTKDALSDHHGVVTIFSGLRA